MDQFHIRGRGRCAIPDTPFPSHWLWMVGNTATTLSLWHYAYDGRLWQGAPPLLPADPLVNYVHCGAGYTPTLLDYQGMATSMALCLDWERGNHMDRDNVWVRPVLWVGHSWIWEHHTGLLHWEAGNLYHQDYYPCDLEEGQEEWADENLLHQMERLSEFGVNSLGRIPILLEGMF